jgi:predicted outer membrane lipoprotein
MSGWSGADRRDLRAAKSKLEYPGFAAKIAAWIGKPVGAGFKLLPGDWNEKVADIAQAALLKALELAVRTMGETETTGSRDRLHRFLVTGSGIAGGAIGLASLPIELPISTAIILRSIADIARSEGHDVSLLGVKLACLEVLAFGGKSAGDEAAEGYWVVRAALARAVSEAAAYIAEKGLAEQGAPPLVRLIAAIASRFGVVVTEEIAAKALPIVGAAAGGAINYLFMDHFQDMARGHFIVRRLEKKYGTEIVERAYAESVL